MSNLIKATHEGKIRLADKELPVAVLQNGKRIITQSALFSAFGRPMRGSRSAGDQDAPKMPGLIDAKNLKPFISNELIDLIKPVEYSDGKGRKNAGYDATVLPLICEVYVDARNSKNENGKSVLTAKQLPNVDAAEMVLRALSRVGIIGLVDEVTGYQEIRPRNALQEFLDTFLAKERAKWVKRFPDEFFELLFEMKGWTWNYASTKKGQFVGRYINDLVYDRLAPAINEELRKKNPVVDKETGRRKGKHHSWLSEDIGVPKLQEHLFALITLAKASGKNWSQFYRMVQRSLPKYGENYMLDFKDEVGEIERSTEISQNRLF